jgi:drug/metabolite transporter (DMT)-like permease
MLNESDPLSSRIMVRFLLAGFITALVSLKRRTVKRQTGPGVTAYVLGAMVIAFSLFGLIWGIASMGVVRDVSIRNSGLSSATITAIGRVSSGYRPSA